MLGVKWRRIRIMSNSNQEYDMYMKYTYVTDT
jgi:hypothetical protein